MTAALRGWHRGRGTFLLAATLVLGAGACGDDAADGGTDGGPSGTVTVLAASSLTDALGEIEARFEAEHPDVDVVISFDGSSSLVAQILEGVPADVFASADEENMAAVVDAQETHGDPRSFARNQLRLAVEPGNPRGITSLADLARDDVVTVLCASPVPCGRLADQALAAAGVELEPASREQNVRAALGRVELGEADAAIVYVTDVLASDAVDGVEIAADENVATSYPAALLANAPNAEGGRAFLEFLAAPAAREVFTDLGFAAP